MVSVQRIVVPLSGELDHTNAYLLRTGKEVLLVDTGYDQPGNRDRLLRELGEVGVAPGDLSGVFLTHLHADHRGLVPHLLEESPATRVFVPRGTRRQHRDRNRFLHWMRCTGVPGDLRRELDDSLAPVEPESDYRTVLARGEPLSPGEPLPLDVEATVLRTPGHTMHHRSLLVEGQRLFSGDQLLPHETPHIGYLPEHGTESPLTEYLNTLQTLARLNPSHVYPGHGDPFSEPKQRIAEMREHHRTRLRETLTEIKAGAETVWEAAHGITWSNGREDLRNFTPMNRFLALAETYAHVLHLRHRSRVRLEENKTPLKILPRTGEQPLLDGVT